jgi:hypothetical protein
MSDCPRCGSKRLYDRVCQECGFPPHTPMHYTQVLSGEEQVEAEGQNENQPPEHVLVHLIFSILAGFFGVAYNCTLQGTPSRCDREDPATAHRPIRRGAAGGLRFSRRAVSCGRLAPPGLPAFCSAWHGPRQSKWWGRSLRPLIPQMRRKK